MAYYTRSGGSFRGRLIMALIVAVMALASYYGSSEYNPLTGEEQRVAISPDQEIALGLQSAPQMAEQFGGRDPDGQAQTNVRAVGERLLARSAAGKTDWKFEFHLLADPKTVNAFALPGGPVFITRGLYRRLESEAQLAGVLAHEIGHVVARHSAQQIAKQRLAQGLSSAAGMAAGDYSASQMAMVVGQVVNMRYGRGDELQSDRLGVRFMSESGYDPRAMTEVMQILAKASGRSDQPEFFSTHPAPENRIERIEQAIAEIYPGGVPSTLER